jgi:sulfur-carrier protein
LKVLIPSPLYSYTEKPEVEAEGTTLGALLYDLDRQFPGVRFRMIDEQDKMRRHMRFFVNGVQTFNLAHELGPGDSVQIVQALSGG